MSQQWRCRWCKAVLHFDGEKGYVHPDGSVYVQVRGLDGELRDDHCVLPVSPKREVR